MKLYLCLFVLLIFLCPPCWADTMPSQEALEKWFASDDPTPPDVQEVNSGELRFLTEAPAKRTPHMVNEITITPQSLQTSWVTIKQCHHNLDPIDAVEVVYRYQQMRALKILSKQNIDKAWIEGQSVQLENVQRGGELCVQLQAHILYQDTDDQFVLRNGPFERKFLDGYFPLHITLMVVYPATQLRFVSSTPAPTPGYIMTQSTGKLHIDTWFEGSLLTELKFQRH